MKGWVGRSTYLREKLDRVEQMSQSEIWRTESTREGASLEVLIPPLMSWNTSKLFLAFWILFLCLKTGYLCCVFY
jgi:hypothetical protein